MLSVYSTSIGIFGTIILFNLYIRDFALFHNVQERRTKWTLKMGMGQNVLALLSGCFCIHVVLDWSLVTRDIWSFVTQETHTQFQANILSILFDSKCPNIYDSFNNTDWITECVYVMKNVFLLFNSDDYTTYYHLLQFNMHAG